MSVRPRVLLAVVLAAVSGCRRSAQPLDDVQRMTYGVKPALVRVNAYATAKFVYRVDVGRVLNLSAAEGGRFASADGLRTRPTFEVETGAGGFGSGFIVHPDGRILTSGHVVAATHDAESLRRDLLRNGALAALTKRLPIEQLRELRSNDRLDDAIEAVMRTGEVKDINIVNDVALSNGEKLPFRVEHYSPALNERGADLALLRIERRSLPVLGLGDSDQVHAGDSIWAFGYPESASSTDSLIGTWLSPDSDLEPTVSPGSITAIKRNALNTPVFQSNAGILAGMSGGPDVNLAGDVVAISTWARSGAESIKFLVPVNVARSFMSEAHVPANVESEFTKGYRAALEAAGGGNWTAASAGLARAAKLFPNSPDVIRFTNETDRRLKQMPLWSKYPLATAAVIVVLIAVLLVIVIPRRQQIPRDLLKVTTETMVSPSSVPPGRPLVLGKFTILNGTRAGERLGLGGSGIRIGRESTICEIVLENPKVSRLHAEVVSIDGKVLLIDRNSSNGTYVNDQKIDKRFLKDGDIIYFGGRNAVAVAFHAA
jgi:S1-C subfamily serine protease